MQDQIYKILSSRSGKPLRQIIRDTKRTDFYLDAQNALDYGLIDAVVAGELPEPKPVARTTPRTPPSAAPSGRAEPRRAGGSASSGGNGDGQAADAQADPARQRRPQLF